jgi:acetyltransferase-like isoleucine patch superfamily enzyme
MHTDPKDFLFSGLAIAAIAALTLLSVRFAIQPWSAPLFGSYHVLVDGVLALLIYGLLSALVVRLLLAAFPLRAGEYPMDDRHFTYWKFYTVVHEFGRGALLPFTTVFAKPLVGLLFGARVGRNTAMGGMLVDPPLITIGDYAILGLDSAIVAHAITSGTIILKEVKVGRSATIGVHAVVMPGADIGEGAVVTAGSVVTMDTRIPPNELWGGIPARKIKDLTPTDVRE